MQFTHIITELGEHGYVSFAGTGRNIIRQFDGKYQGMHVGDNIIMHHTSNPQTHGAAEATEMLRVSAIAISTLDRLLDQHWRNNEHYRIRKTRQGMKEELAGLKASILHYYPAPADQERDPNTPFICIYF